MAEYIDRKKIRYHFEVGEDTAIEGRSVAYKTMIDSMPTEDVVPVVRCKDCTEWDEDECECSHWYGFKENDYCSYGERKDDNGNL